MGREKSNSKGLENKFVIASGFFDVAEYGEQGLYAICVKFAYKKHDLNETKTLDFWYFGSYNKTRFIEYSFFCSGAVILILNQATDYAFRAVLYLSNLPPGEVVEAKVISESQHIPLRFLLKILRMLAKTGIVKSYQGVGGGYALGKKPCEITLRDVLEAIEGPIRINKCLIDPAFCSKQGTPHCPVHRVLDSIQQAISQEFAKYNFEQLKGYPNH